MLGVVSFFLTLYIIREHTYIRDAVFVIAICMFTTALPIAIFDLFVFKRHEDPVSGLGEKNDPDWKRIAIKMLGFYSTIAVMSFLFWVFPDNVEGKKKADHPKHIYRERNT